MKQLNWYQIFGNTHIIPDGRTVTPTDDIQTLLHCANIWDKSYTTLAEVLADDDTLFLICISNNAIDYLVRSTTFAGVALVPAMTSATTPSGVVTASSNLSTYYPYLAFDKVGTTQWIPNINSSTTGSGYIDYGFPSSVIITSFLIEGSGSCNFTCKLQGSNDGNTWTDLTSLLSVTSSSYSHTVCFSNSTSYSKYRLVVNKTATGEWLRINTLQFYSTSIVADEESMEYIGASDYASETLLSDSTWLTAIDGSAYKDYVINAKVPTMTSDTAPEGQVLYSTQYNASTYAAWHGFDGNDSSTWSAASGDSNCYIGYKFTRNVKIYKAFVHLYADSAKTIQIRNSADGVTWDDIGSSQTIAAYGNGTFILQPANKLSYWSAKLSAAAGVYTLQFSGRENGGVQSWLKAGGITNKKYTTVSEVLSDLTTLATLMSSTDAIDYLVTAKGWATEICSDSNAMADIGMNNYAANTLLADSVWREAICNSTYKTSVLNVTNPNMTDNTHPYGECFASSIYSSDYAEWKAFTGSINTRGWNCNSSEYNKLDQAYIGYAFTSAVKVCMIEFIYNTNSTAVSSSEIRVVANDNSADAWNVMSDVYTGTGTGQTERKIILNSYAPYKRIALKGSFYQGQRYFQICKATIYGRKDI